MVKFLDAQSFMTTNFQKETYGTNLLRKFGKQVSLVFEILNAQMRNVCLVNILNLAKEDVGE
jgi:hypothetical protein